MNTGDDEINPESPPPAEEVEELSFDLPADATDLPFPDFPESGEAADPAQAVEEMLLAEVPETPFGEEAPLPALSEAQGPSFQLQLLGGDSSAKEKLKAIAAQHSVPFAETLLSQLSEYQALVIRQEALKLGIPVRVQVDFPLPGLSEEEQALGELAAVPEAPALASEGAPSIPLLAKERDVVLFTETPQSFRVETSFGLVTAHRSIARRFFREEEAQDQLRREMARFPDQKSPLPASRFEQLLREIALDLQKAALRLGGNAVLGIRLEAFPETTNLDPSMEQLRLVAFGTAAVVEKA